MEFKELPEIAQNAACNLLRDTHRESADKNATAKEIRDAFIALYSEVENTETYKNSDSVVKESTCGTLCKKYMEHGVHAGTASISSTDEILDRIKMSKFTFMSLVKGIQGLDAKEIESAKEDFKLYINGGYIPLIVERRATLELGNSPMLSIYRQQVRHALQLAKVLHAKKDENGRLTEADFYDTNKAIFKLASALNQMQKQDVNIGWHVRVNQ